MKDEMPHKLPISSVIDEIFVNQRKKLIVIHKECTVWKKDGKYYLYAFSGIRAIKFSCEEIMKSFNDYFNRRK